MKILQIYKDVHPFKRGGIERYVHDLSKYLAGRGHDVNVLVAGNAAGGPQGNVSGFSITRYPYIFRILSNPISLRLRKILKTIPADIVHFHTPLPIAVISWLLSGRDIPYVVTYHSDIVRQAVFLPVYGPFLRKFLTGAGKVIATSPVYRKNSKYLSELTNTEVVPIGSDPDVFKPSETTGNGNYVLFAGRFRKYKGIEVLLNAWKVFPDKQLLMAGGGPLENTVRKRIQMDNLNVKIVKDPSDSELVGLYQRARCLVLPSTLRSEAFGMVQTEAMACGIPVISTSLPTGVSWVNLDNETGLIVPPGDPLSLADAVRKMDDPSIHAKLSRGALERAKQHFNAKELFSRIESLLEEAVNA